MDPHFFWNLGSEYVGEDTTFGEEVKFIFVRLSVLREYLRRDLSMPNLPFPYDFERAVGKAIFNLHLIPLGGNHQKYLFFSNPSQGLATYKGC